MVKIQKRALALGVASLSLLAGFAPVSISINNSQSQSLLSFQIGDGSALAQKPRAYTPPGGRLRPQRTEGSGARGCTNSIPVTVNLLTPQDHIARTTEAHPTFLWNVSGATTAPMVFTLIERGVSQPLYSKTLKANKAGIVELQLPPESPELKIGKEYRWTVALVCNEKRASQNINARAWIERVATSSQLKQELTSATNDRERALVYTQNGIWYDGLATLNQAKTSDSEKTEAINSFSALLREVGLEKISKRRH
jgi:Domain of Unknown Function (DUF928)